MSANERDPSSRAVRSVVRALVMAALGALVGGGSLVLAYAFRPGVTFDMSRPLPPYMASGFYPPERAGELTFAWTSRRADIRLAGLDRTGEWQCSVRLRAGRGPDLAQPRVEIAVDGLSVADGTVTNDFADLPFTAASRSTPGLSLSITSTPTFVPGPSDTRELGVIVDTLQCRPAGGFVLPPRATLRDAALATAVFGAALGLAGTTLSVASVVTLLLAAGQAFLLSTGEAPYGDYPRLVLQFAAWIAALMVLLVKLPEILIGDAHSRSVRFIAICSAAVLYLKILGLLHPAKLLADAVFHAHRLEWVLSGRYFFTQVMPSGVSFPYAIGLYLFASPWASLTHDHVTLLRVVVCAADAMAGGMIYLAIVKVWKDPLAAAFAAILYNVVPLTFGILGDANLTNLFAQSAAVVALMAATILPLGRRAFLSLVVLFALFALAFLSHISTFAVLSLTAVALAALYWWRGGEIRHRAALSLLAVTVTAALFAVVTYYGHFADVYATALHQRNKPAPAAQMPPPSGPSQRASAPGSTASTPVATRVERAWVLTVSGVGWPILVLSAVGVWRVWISGLRDRLALALGAWGVAYFGYLGVGILMPVGPEFQRYAAEFVGRVNLASYPAAAILAAMGAAWAWRSGTPARVAAAVLLLLAIAGGVRQWAGWIL